jgi:F-type H+-transporting ATPase subunit b
MLQTAEFWVAVAFFVFIGILLYYRVPGIMNRMLDERAEDIRRELDSARRLRDEAQQLLADYRKKQSQADEEARAILELAQCEAESLAKETRESLADTVERRTRLAEDKIARAEAQAVAEVRSAAVDVAVAAAERIVRDKTAGPAGTELIDKAITELRGKLH